MSDRVEAAPTVTAAAGPVAREAPAILVVAALMMDRLKSPQVKIAIGVVLLAIAVKLVFGLV